ncbi:hypothetical protein BOTBODRAFT_134607 [Botryobasidium botryosum FD-172 SS1]|uniref:Uncharacterized protein n=1 Tax=Botryobasidium botryosum (strain FD-172 SS1) TaxID=930990 RepID=A0A067MCM8_BOTB1|nr:hypothetical protein BOTBODRAFT_134607 [Botryobasidium botryosum FD-172 SS1]
MRPFSDEPWNQNAKIVIAFDIGTTQTAVSFTHLYPGGSQVLHRVLQWPGQESQGGEAKIPSLVWYDQLGQARAFGAEANTHEVLDEAEDNGWKLAKYFKLHLHPASQRNTQQLTLEPLPFDVTVDEIYADFMDYLFQQTKKYFKERILDGERTWDTLEGTIELIIAHPNGWDLREQSVLRNAAVEANVMPSSQAAQERVHFVSEAEASVHFVLLGADIEDRLKIYDDFVVCDAGGSTVDTTVYSVDETVPLIRLKEKRASACVQAGAIFVNKTAEEYFTQAFTDAGLDEETVSEFVAAAMDSFEMETKRRFKDPAETKIISVGGRKFSNTDLNVRRGAMTIQGSQIQRFFDPWVEKILESVNAQIAGHPVQYLLLVGGFGESPYLRQKLQDGPGSNGIRVTIADHATSKAVADGAVIWFVRHVVTARATRYAFGINILVPVNSISERGEQRVVQTLRGPRISTWRELVSAGKVLDNSTEIRSGTFYWDYDNNTPDLGSSATRIYVYEGQAPAPKFIYDEDEEINPGFRPICTVEADLSGLIGALVCHRGPMGVYWTVDFSIAFKFGGTELQAFLVWKEKGKACRGPASIIPVSQL